MFEVFHGILDLNDLTCKTNQIFQGNIYSLNRQGNPSEKRMKTFDKIVIPQGFLSIV